ncbi:GNAT family N-acetyltransferase [Herbidospora sp. NBRC 101105]|uniref:GNAT family N-acetyltransferase n=1 Tax=Herbidospora sp. NBRC 101105 TaxID=3032195 RepID=UPI0024A22B30|nr:GNAT family N-acetyltransferase [Herbidospora sp. NBRC 101105]GLX96811.1 hypothetical protein Hesp01_47610 [Herbidospora sp. NBRC 101105]
MAGAPRIRLTPLTPADLDAHLAGQDEQLTRWYTGGPSTREATAAYLHHCVTQWERRGPLRAFGIRVDDTPAGTLDLRFAGDEVDIAYGLYPSWRGRGLATRAVLLACRYAASEGARLAVIKVDPANPVSAAVARRAGFTFAGRDTTFDRHTLPLTP